MTRIKTLAAKRFSAYGITVSIDSISVLLFKPIFHVICRVYLVLFYSLYSTHECCRNLFVSERLVIIRTHTLRKIGKREAEKCANVFGYVSDKMHSSYNRSMADTSAFRVKQMLIIDGISQRLLPTNY